MISKPMLAVALPDSTAVSFPLLASPKIDGIRAIKVDGKLLSLSLKQIPNIAARAALVSWLPDGADGELVFGTTFQETTSAVMSANFTPNQPFKFYWFDYVKDSASTP
jgi:DNA ligase-1